MATNRKEQDGITRRDFTSRVGRGGGGRRAWRRVLHASRPRRNGRVLGANDRVVAASIGVRGQGNCAEARLRAAEERRDQDAVRHRREPGAVPHQRPALADVPTFKPNFVQDMRRVLDDKDIDAVVIATPNHWHALATIWALQAGKHVYVEKPASHTVWEGRRMVEAADALRQDRPGRHDEPQPARGAAGNQVHAGRRASARSTWRAACASSRALASASTRTVRWRRASSTS